MDDIKLKKQFIKDGYIILDLFEYKQVDLFRSKIFELCSLGLGHKINNFDQFSTAMLNVYNNDRQKFVDLVRRFYYMTELALVASSNKVIDTLKSIGLSNPVFCSHPEVRTDNPSDSKYMQPMHQDWRYGQGSYDSVTIWTPLCDATKKNGSISVYPGSHNLGFIDVEEILNPRRFKSKIEKDEVEKLGYCEKIIEIKKYKSVIFSQFLLHHSNNNLSDQVRLSFQCRYSNLADINYIKNRFAAPKNSDLIWEKTPAKEELRKIFS